MLITHYKSAKIWLSRDIKSLLSNSVDKKLKIFIFTFFFTIILFFRLKKCSTHQYLLPKKKKIINFWIILAKLCMVIKIVCYKNSLYNKKLNSNSYIVSYVMMRFWLKSFLLQSSYLCLFSWKFSYSYSDLGLIVLPGFLSVPNFLSVLRPFTYSNVYGLSNSVIYGILCGKSLKLTKYFASEVYSFPTSLKSRRTYFA